MTTTHAAPHTPTNLDTIMIEVLCEHFEFDVRLSICRDSGDFEMTSEIVSAYDPVTFAPMDIEKALEIENLEEPEVIWTALEIASEL